VIKNKEDYLNIFRVGEPQLRLLVAEALKGGGDYSDLYFEFTTYGNLMLRDSEVTSGGLHVDFGVGIRVLSGEKTGYAYSESTEMKDMVAAARAASAIAGGEGSTGSVNVTPEEAAAILKRSHDLADSFVPLHSNGERCVRKFFPGEPNPAADRYPVEIHWRRTECSAHLPFLNKLEEAVRRRDSRIIKVTATLAFQVTDVLMFNSLGELKYDTRPLASVAVSCVFSQGGKTENRSVSRSWRMGVEMLSDALVETLAEDAVKGIDERFEASRPKGGKMPVVMGAGASGILLHEAMGHAFEADFARKGQSIFTGRIGQRVCREGINILDDATIRYNRGALNYDDEGVPGQKTYMVEDGILTSGTATPSDLIGSVKKGIYVDEFSNGQVQIGEGDFTFYVKSGFLIEEGRLTRPVKDINIIGNGPRALAEMTGVAGDLIVDESAWTCGKSQNVPVSCGIPTVLIESLTVGGE